MVTNRRLQGACFEQHARIFLQSKGLIFIAANQFFKGGEIDLIMRDKQIIVFVEIRQRKNTGFGSAVESVTLSKQKKWLLAANLWLAQYDASLETTLCRFDLIAFGDTKDQLQWLPNFIEVNT